MWIGHLIFNPRRHFWDSRGSGSGLSVPENSDFGSDQGPTRVPVSNSMSTMSPLPCWSGKIKSCWFLTNVRVWVFVLAMCPMGRSLLNWVHHCTSCIRLYNFSVTFTTIHVPSLAIRQFYLQQTTVSTQTLSILVIDRGEVTRNYIDTAFV